MTSWTPDLSLSDKPRYLAIADAIEEDIRSGRLAANDRLPPQRSLAKRLAMDFTTVARGYGEAQKRGLIHSRVGQGTYVTPASRRGRPRRFNRPGLVDLSMNLPPEPSDPDLLERMQAVFAEVGRDIVALSRYQGFGGSPADKEAATSWLGRRALVPSHDRLFVTPGAHPALLAIAGTLARAGDTIVCEALTYPGMRAVAAQLGLELVGLPMDREGIDADSFAAACRRLNPKALYVNPTLHNPTTVTISESRRAAIASVARLHNVPIIEDDAYGFIPAHPPPPFAAIAPDLTWHIAGLAKCLGAGLRAAYVIAPDARSGWPLVSSLRTATVMASPITVAIVTRWIEDGTADMLLRFIRNETASRQKLAAEILGAYDVLADPLSFNLWVRLPQPWTRSAFVGLMRSTGVGVVASDAFCVSDTPPESVRVCLGGPIERAALRTALEFMAHALSDEPAHASSFL